MTRMFFFDGRERFFVADFYCPERRLVIEMDGGVHDREEQRQRDELRGWIMNRMGSEY